MDGLEPVEEEAQRLASSAAALAVKVAGWRARVMAAARLHDVVAQVRCALLLPNRHTYACCGSCPCPVWHLHLGA